MYMYPYNDHNNIIHVFLMAGGEAAVAKNHNQKYRL